MQPERPSLWMPAALVAAVVALAVGLTGHLLLETGLRQSKPSLEEATRTGATAVGQAVAQQIAHAIELGIPLDRLPGTEAYLQRIVESSPQVDGMALLDGSGGTIAATRPDVEGERFPIAVGGVRATLVVAAESPLIDQAVGQARMALAVATLFSGVLAGGIVVFFFAFRQNPARQRFLDDLARVAGGDFTVRPAGEERGPLAEATRALSARVEGVKAARRGLAEASATIRAIDFDGSLGSRVDAIQRPIEERYRFAQDQDDELQSAVAAEDRSAAWRVALIAGLYATAFPYVANFAIDREPVGISAAWIPILPLLAEIIAIVLGSLLARTRLGRGGTMLALGSLALGASLAGTYWCRDYDVFVMLRAAAGFSGSFVVAALLTHFRIDLGRKSLSLLLVFAALFAGQLLAGIYGEAIGRRSGFLMLGLAVLLATPFIAIGTQSMVRHGPPAAARRRPNGYDVLLGLSVVPAAAAILVILPAGIGYDDYLTTGMAVAALALATLAVPALPVVASAAAPLAAAAVLHYPVSPPALTMIVACAAIGVGLGGAMKSVIAEAGRPWTAVGAGVVAALALAGVAAQLAIPFAAVVAAAAVLLAAAGLFRTSPTQAVPG